MPDAGRVGRMGRVEPMLAGRAVAPADVPRGPGWVYEVKWDGVRLLADTRTGRLQLRTRTGRDVTGALPELSGIESLVGVVLDGEAVVLEAGRPSFSGVMRRLHARAEDGPAGPVAFVVFDLLAADGQDLRRLPFAERRALLDALDLPPRVTLSPVHDDVDDLLAATRAEGLEGVMAKRAASRYRSGRSEDWVKVPHRTRRSALVCGWRPERGGSGRVGALLLGAPDASGGLRFLGRAGSGLSGALMADLAPVLAASASASSPFAEPIAHVDADGAHWCTGEAVIDVTYLGRTASGRLRHPVLIGLRDDVPPDPWVDAGPGGPVVQAQVQAQAQLRARVAPLGLAAHGGSSGRRRTMANDDATVLEVDGHAVRLTHPDKVLYPETGTTKSDLLDYVARVQGPLLAQLHERPVTRIRYPHGMGDLNFFEKNVPAGAPTWVRRQVLPASPGSPDEGKDVTYPFFDGLSTLLWAVNQGALELHTPQWTAGPRGGIRGSDRLVIDLDPGEGTGLAECVVVAELVRDRLAEDGLVCLPVTSGSKGLQLYAPFARPQKTATVHRYAEAVARELAAAHPDFLTANIRKAERTGRVLLDWSQNSPAKTTITPYSPRARDGATAAAPRRWAELDDHLSQLTQAQVAERVEQDGDVYADELARLGGPQGTPHP